MGIGDPAAIDGVARRAHGRAQRVGQLADEREVLGLSHASAARDDLVGVLDVGLVGFNALEAEPFDGRFEPGFGHVDRHDLALARRVGVGRATRARADRGHLRAMVGRDDGGENVPADGGPRLHEVAGLGIHVEPGAVGRESRVQLDSEVRHERAAGRGRARNKDLGGALLHELLDGRRMGADQEVRKLRRLDHVNAVRATGDQLLEIGALNALADHHGAKLRVGRTQGAVPVGQLSAPREKLMGNRAQASCVLFGKGPDLVAHGVAIAPLHSLTEGCALRGSRPPRAPPQGRPSRRARPSGIPSRRKASRS